MSPKSIKELPGCPPTEAEQIEGDLYKAIDGRQPQDRDFESFAERKRPQIDPYKCESWGLSVWTHLEAVEHALDAYPHFSKKRIIKFTVGKSDGCLKCTPSKKQPDHHTFWKAENCNLLNACEIIIIPGGK